MPNTTPPNEPRCSFCGKTETQANQLVSGPDGVHICDECIATCNEMMAQNAIEQVREDERLLTPQEIKARLDEYVIGQDEAKKILADAGIEEIPAEGAAFDPNLHDALTQMPHDTVPADHVAAVHARGWKKGEKILRHAQVIVSIGPAT